MASMIYKWRPGSRGIKIAAKVAGAELEKIRTRNNGRLTPDLIVSAAKAKSSPLHSVFEWNNRKAADQWRLEQASYLIRSIEVVVTLAKGKEPIAARAFVNVRRGDDRSYTSVGHAMSEEELRTQVLQEAWRELSAWREQYHALKEFGRLHPVIDRLMKRRKVA